MSMIEAVESGVRRRVLEEQLLILAVAVVEAPVEQLPGLSRELRLVSKELEGLPGAAVVTMGDALAERRSLKTANS